jgi:hypothetical protein
MESGLCHIEAIHSTRSIPHLIQSRATNLSPASP